MQMPMATMTIRNAALTMMVMLITDNKNTVQTMMVMLFTASLNIPQRTAAGLIGFGPIAACQTCMWMANISTGEPLKTVCLWLFPKVRPYPLPQQQQQSQQSTICSLTGIQASASALVQTSLAANL